MASKKIKWPSNAVLTRRSNSTYYSYFIATSKGGNNATMYKLGDCVSIKVNRRISVMIAEIVELFVDDSVGSDSDEDDSKDKVAIRLYALPEDTPNGRNHNHGEHELVMFYKQIVLSCHQFLSMEQIGNSWTQGIPLQPVSDPPLPPSPAPSNASSAASLLYCYEPMVPIGLFEYEEQTGVSPCSSPIANRLTPPTSPTNNPRIKVVSELVYCRYRAVLARFGTDSAYQYMNLPRVKMLGGLPVPPVTTKIMFCKKTFRDINLERKLDHCISKSVAFSVIKNRRPSSSLSPSPPSTTSSDNNPDPIKRRNRSSVKRRRGRPRKDGATSAQQQNKNVADSEVNCCTPSPLKQKRHLDDDKCLPPSKRSPSNINIKGGMANIDEESPIGGESGSRKRGSEVYNNVDMTSPCKRRKLPSNMSNASSMIVQPTATAEMITSGTTYPPLRHEEHDVTIEPRLGEEGVNTAYSSSGASLVDSETLVHSLRPRSTLLPPPQFRDECYDMQSSHYSPKNNNDHDPMEMTSPVKMDDRCEPHCTCNKPSIASPLKTGGTLVATPTKEGPIEHKKLKVSMLSQAEITEDVKELLKAYLSCLQQVTANHNTSNGGNDSSTRIESINSHLETHLINEKSFLDLLFCFMKLRKTPIHRVPRLGSRNLNLFELYKVTMTLGGYEQVTINRKWSHVFDSLGCAAGMTCASTVTRKHYEKLLLPFERALNAMKK